jgi:hypothetical protein
METIGSFSGLLKRTRCNDIAGSWKKVKGLAGER